MGGTIASHSCLGLVRSRHVFQIARFEPGQCILQFLQLLISQGLSSTFCTLSSHCQCFAHSFIIASQRSNNLAFSSSFLKVSAPPLHSAKSSTALRTLDHLIHPCLDTVLQPNYTIFAWFLLLLDWSHAFSRSAACRQQLSNPPSVSSVHSSF